MQGIKYHAIHHWKVQIIWSKTYHPFRGRNIFKKQTQNKIFLNKMQHFMVEKKTLLDTYSQTT